MKNLKFTLLYSLLTFLFVSAVNVQTGETLHFDPTGNPIISGSDAGFPTGNNAPPVNTLIDLAGGDNNGTLNNFVLNGATSNWVEPGPSITPAPVLAEALDFDGTNDYVIIQDDPSQNLGTNFTLEIWFKQEVGGNNNSFRALFDKRDVPTNNTNFSMAVFGGTIPTIFINHGGVNSVFDFGSSLFTLGNWNHYAVTYDGSNILMFVNGNLVKTIPAIISNPQLNVPINIGRAAFGDEYFDGQLDEARIWNITRTAAEIQDNYQNELIGNEAGLVAYYNFNQGIAGGDNTSPAIDKLTDLATTIGGNNEGTLTNFTLNGATSNWVEPGPSLTPAPAPTGCTTVIGCTDDLIDDVEALNLSAASEDVLTRILIMAKDRIQKNGNTGATNLYNRFKFLVDREITNATDAAALKASADAIIAMI